MRLEDEKRHRLMFFKLKPWLKQNRDRGTRRVGDVF